MGVPKEAVEIIIYEAPKSNWATGGQLHSEKHANTPSLKHHHNQTPTFVEEKPKIVGLKISKLH